MTPLYRSCPLTAWEGEHARCRWCNAPLEGRRTVWCSDEHATLFWRNHLWGNARVAAARRDGFRCVECGRRNGDPTELAALRPRREQRTFLEVHHLEPVKGRHGQVGCHHHLDGLVTLCRDCHVAAHAALRTGGAQLRLA
jgi:5-methylcytosine-specific restriction endonuclease McrA